MDTEQVIDRMLQCTAGQIVACNIVAGIDNGLIRRRLAKEAFDWLGRLAGFQPRYQTPRELVKALVVLRGGDFPESVKRLAPSPEFRLRGDATIDPRDLTGSVSCILPAWLLNRLIAPSDLERLRGEGLVFPSSNQGFRSTATIERWRRMPAVKRRVRFNPNAALGRRHSVVWFTRRRDLAAALGRRDRRDSAQRARDSLGLVHHGRGVVLAALHFPARIFEHQASARPAFTDAADHRRFRTWPDGRRAQSNRSWGYTVDLHALDRGAASADGCPERVTREIPGSDLPEDGRFELDLLGAVEKALGDGSDADDAYAARLLGGLSGGSSIADLAHDLKEIYRPLSAPAKSRWRRAVTEMLAEHGHDPQRREATGVLIDLAVLMPAYEALEVLPGVVADAGEREAAGLYDLVVAAAIELARQTGAARSCLERLRTSPGFSPAYAGIIFIALCRADPDGWPDHVMRMRPALQALVETLGPDSDSPRWYAESFLHAVTLARLDRNLHVFAKRGEPPDDWLWNELFKGERSLLVLDAQNNLFLREKPAVSIPLGDIELVAPAEPPEVRLPSSPSDGWMDSFTKRPESERATARELVARGWTPQRAQAAA